ncbi:hypothetical protein [Deinococcus arcticus]|uniref:Tetratricopeptide repeat protein n=1 Tax=Deinococcus arcticus TaxID=2136176 RepID=A0A2T3WA22_9DEIO|nr:hypothetical protein [Deinococcus arcticus]PTA68758.1 hypothetical protein C8263_05825 [Deinococcus arcticus]
MKRGALLAVLISSLAGAASVPDLLLGGDYARAYEAAQAARDPLNASRAAAAQAEYRAGGRDWVARAVEAGRQATREQPRSPDAALALGSALGLQARAGGYTLGALRTAHEARDALDRALALAPARPDVQAVLAEWHAGAWARARIFGGGNPDRARTLALGAVRAAPDNIFVQTHAGLALALLRDPGARAVLTRAAALEARSALDRDLQVQARQALGPQP